MTTLLYVRTVGSCATVVILLNKLWDKIVCAFLPLCHIVQETRHLGTNRGVVACAFLPSLLCHAKHSVGCCGRYSCLPYIQYYCGQFDEMCDAVVVGWEVCTCRMLAVRLGTAEYKTENRRICGAIPVCFFLRIGYLLCRRCLRSV